MSLFLVLMLGAAIAFAYLVYHRGWQEAAVATAAFFGAMGAAILTFTEAFK